MILLDYSNMMLYYYYDTIVFAFACKLFPFSLSEIKGREWSQRENEAQRLQRTLRSLTPVECTQECYDVLSTTPCTIQRPKKEADTPFRHDPTGRTSREMSRRHKHVAEYNDCTRKTKTCASKVLGDKVDT